MQDKLPQTILESVGLIPLPPLPQVLVRFLALVEDEQTPLVDLATLVAQDPAFTAQLLTIATSSPYRQETAAISLEQFLAAIGRPLLRTLTSCMAAQNTQIQAIYKRNFDYAGYWCHSLRVAALARSLAAAVGYQNVEEAYLAGLLHDIGQLLLVGGVAEFCNILPGACDPESGVTRLTTILNGIDHASVGARLVDSWQLSSFMADAVLFHQFPAEQIRSAELLCRIVWSAHRLDARAGDEAPGIFPHTAAVSAILGIEVATIVKACQPPRPWVEELAASLGVKIPRAEAVSPESSYIYRYASLPKQYARDADQPDLETWVRTLAVMQPLQESLLTLGSEADFYGALRETARLLARPVSV